MPVLFKLFVRFCFCYKSPWKHPIDHQCPPLRLQKKKGGKNQTRLKPPCFLTCQSSCCAPPPPPPSAPQIQDLPILYDDDTFLCAEIWQGPGDDDLIQVIIVVFKNIFLGGA